MKILLMWMVTVATVHVSQISSSEADVKDEGYKYGPTETEVEAALEKAREINLLKKNINLFSRDSNNQNSARCPLSYHHGIRQYGGDNLAESKANDALLAVRILIKDGGYNSTDLQQESTRNIFKRLKAFTCDVPEPSPCDFRSRYRNADGSCNNVQTPDWGMAGSIQQRVLPNDYDDNLGSPRTRGLGNRPLPNPRLVSNLVHRNPGFQETISNKLTLHVMGFGQFLDHDVAITPGQATVQDCCEKSSRDDTDNCFNIIIPKKSDESSSIFVAGHCMEVKRSAPVFCPDATSVGNPIRQQTNGLTSFIDASNLYGSSVERQRELRENGNGFRMKTTIFGRQERLPDRPSGGCVLTNTTQSCSDAGDPRVNEIPTLSSYHYLFVLEHNRIAELIKDFFTDDEIIFQETRRLVIAIMQTVVYDQFLPSFISPAGLWEYNLRSSARYVYERDTNPTLLNAFGIAYRVGHTWVPSQIQLFSRLFRRINQEGFTRNTENVFLNPDMTYLPNAYERLAYYLSGRQSPQTDNVLEEAVRSRLFLNTAANTAFDLAALNIQRGRDHGLPSYNEYRKWCGLSAVKRSWKSQGGDSGLVDHTPAMRKLLRRAGYRSPSDIDLFVGGLTEKRTAGGDLGPTFECLIATHFRSLKFGDRLWYQNEDAGFSNAQISAIQRYSFAKILCNNYNFARVHCPSAFDSRDPLTECREIPDLDLSVFTDSTSEESESSVEESEENKSSESSKSNGFWFSRRRTNRNSWRRPSNGNGWRVRTNGKAGRSFSKADELRDSLNNDDEEDLSVDEEDISVEEDTLNVDEELERMIDELENN